MDVDQASIELAAGYALTDRLTVIGGLRYADIEARIAVNGPSSTLVKGSSAHDWVDPIVGLQYTVPLSGKWSFALRGDVGGFGIGSDLAWQGLVTLRFDLSERVAAVAAYRYIDTTYDSGSGANYFRYDVVTAGPALGLAIAF
jgi:predicted porin